MPTDEHRVFLGGRVSEMGVSFLHVFGRNPWWLGLRAGCRGEWQFARRSLGKIYREGTKPTREFNTEPQSARSFFLGRAWENVSFLHVFSRNPWLLLLCDGRRGEWQFARRSLGKMHREGTKPTKGLALSFFKKGSVCRQWGTPRGKPQG